jgi:transcription initiation factor TFIIF subunit beta
MNATFEQLLLKTIDKERHKECNTPMRQIRMIDEAGVLGGRGRLKRLSSGVGVGAGGALQFLSFFSPSDAR